MIAGGAKGFLETLPILNSFLFAPCGHKPISFNIWYQLNMVSPQLPCLQRFVKNTGARGTRVATTIF